MQTKEAIKANLSLSRQILEMFTADLTDADLLVRPVDAANCIAWQLGHLITTETRIQASIPGLTPFALPTGFAELHTKETAKADPQTVGFLTKSQYLGLYAAVRAVTLSALPGLADADLDQPSPPTIARIAPTLGHVLLLAGSHLTLHLGQFSVVRRLLGKPVLF